LNLPFFIFFPYILELGFNPILSDVRRLKKQMNLNSIYWKRSERKQYEMPHFDIISSNTLIWDPDVNVSRPGTNVKSGKFS
jgi:hypothetical protein